MEAAGAGAGDRRTGEERTPLRRAISQRMLLAFVVGDVLGAGI